MNPQTSRDVVTALFCGGSAETRVEALTEVVIQLLVELEALRDVVGQMSSERGAAPPAAAPARRARVRYPDTQALEGKSAYAKAYVEAAYLSHDASGPSSGVEKLLARFYPNEEATSREALMLRRLGFSEEETARFAKVADDAEMFT